MNPLGHQSGGGGGGGETFGDGDKARNQRASVKLIAGSRPEPKAMVLGVRTASSVISASPSLESLTPRESLRRDSHAALDALLHSTRSLQACGSASRSANPAAALLEPQHSAPAFSIPRAGQGSEPSTIGACLFEQLEVPPELLLCPRLLQRGGAGQSRAQLSQIGERAAEGHEAESFAGSMSDFRAGSKAGSLGGGRSAPENLMQPGEVSRPDRPIFSEAMPEIEGRDRLWSLDIVMSFVSGMQQQRAAVWSQRCIVTIRPCLLSGQCLRSNVSRKLPPAECEW
jgi:hypothetical protein